MTGGAGTSLTGLLGWPLGHSVSPAMHNAAFVALGLDWLYVSLPCRPEQLSEAVRGLTALGFRGANVTIPYKEAVLEHVHAVSPEAAAVGAANTLSIRGGRLEAHNTDAAGFAGALDEAGCRPQRAVVLGAGGAARAVAFSLLQLGAAVTLASRSRARAEALAASLPAGRGRVRVCGLAAAELQASLAGADLLVNATPVGMWPDEAATPLPTGCCLTPGLTVMDLVYNPLETTLLRQATEAGARTVDGLGMLVHQGTAAFRLWTGREAPPAVMRAAAVTALTRTRHGGGSEGSEAGLGPGKEGR